MSGTTSISPQKRPTTTNSAMSTLSPEPSGFRDLFFKDPENERFSWYRSSFVLGPALLTLGSSIVAAALWQWQIPSLTSIISGVAITGGFLFGLLIFVFQLRLQIAHDPRVQQRKQVPRLIDQLFGLVLVASATAGVLTALLVLASLTVSTNIVGAQLAPSEWWSPAIATTGVFLLTLLVLVLMRVRGAYRMAVRGNEITPG